MKKEYVEGFLARLIGGEPRQPLGNKFIHNGISAEVRLNSNGKKELFLTQLASNSSIELETIEKIFDWATSSQGMI